MTMVNMLVLANSRKLNGRCVAGRLMRGDEVTDVWVRPTSAHGSGELYEKDRTLESGDTPEVLDIVRVPIRARTAGCHQPENLELEAGQPWEKIGSLPLDGLRDLTEVPDDIWLDGSTSTFHGQLNIMSHEHADATLRSSLVMVEVDDLSLEVLAPSANFGDLTRRVLGTFSYHDRRYAMRVTDVATELEYIPRGDGNYAIGAAIIVLSVAEEYQGSVSKLIATVLPIEAR